MYILYSCQMSHYGKKNKFLINQKVGEENKPVLQIKTKEEYLKRNITRLHFHHHHHHHPMLNQHFQIEEDFVYLYKVMHDDVRRTLMPLMCYPSNRNKY